MCSQSAISTYLQQQIAAHSVTFYILRSFWNTFNVFKKLKQLPGYVHSSEIIYICVDYALKLYMLHYVKTSDYNA
jgi:hypothetical protein